LLKEIYEQPQSRARQHNGARVLDTGKIYLDLPNIGEEEFNGLTSIKIAAAEQAGTPAWRANICLKNSLAFRSKLIMLRNFVIAIRFRRKHFDDCHFAVGGNRRHDCRNARSENAGCKVLAICNVLGSMIHREADGTILTHAGPEISVASTKAFTTQMIALYLFSIYLGSLRGKIDETQAKRYAQQLTDLPSKIERILNDADTIEELSKEFFRVQDFLYLGRGVNFPVALEGALKLKEISYIHAEGYPAGEMKHGPNALIDEKLPVVIVNTKEEGNAGSELRYEKTHSNIVEVKSRDGIILSVLTEGDTMSSKVSNHVIEIPETSDLLAPILSIVPLQLLAYYIAVRRGCDVDQPRNLAKSVTVE
jgi:glucosamine--fructose-6-phosphate aminotransferase (isomerizing)